MILVVGAGIAGLAAAIGLSRFGSVTLVERRSAVAANSGAGIQLSPNAVKSLAAIGAREAVEAVATRPAGLSIWTAGRRRPTVELDYGTAMEPRFGAPYWTISRDALHGSLLKIVETLSSITIHYEHGVSRLVGEGTGWRTDRGDHAEFVVAADGVGSPLRASLFGDRPEETSAVAWRGTAQSEARTIPDQEDALAGAPTTRLLLAPGSHLVRYAIGRGDNMVLVAPRRTQHPTALRHRAMRAACEAVEGWTPWPIRVHRRHRFGVGSVALVGDASHAMPPFLAQGGAMALEDAAILTASVGAFGPTAKAVEAYATARRARLRRLASLTDRQGSLYHLPEPLASGRDLVMRRLGADAALERVEFIYSWSPPVL